MRSRTGLSLLELLILILMVGLLSVVVVPKLTEASGESRQDFLSAEREMVQAKIQVYRLQHGGRYPGEDFVSQMTLRTNAAGRVMPVGAKEEDYPFGPYLSAIPANPFARREVADHVDVGAEVSNAVEAGWRYDPRTGRFDSHP